MSEILNPERYLEVGVHVNGREVVINHPDLEPDENGVGHIVFSPQQARNLAHLLLKHANSIDRRTVERIELSPGGHEMHVTDEIEIEEP